MLPFLLTLVSGRLRDYLHLNMNAKGQLQIWGLKIDKEILSPQTCMQQLELVSWHYEPLCGFPPQLSLKQGG